MKWLPKILFLIFSVALFVYLLLPNYPFPDPLPGSVQSMEGADTETPLRRGYFTDFTRAEILDFYQKQINISPFLNLPLSSLRLNYPPEEAQTLIRDQTHSVFLQEFVHPLRESVFINGFRLESEDGSWYKGVHYQYKIIVRFVPSSYISRIIVGLTVVISVLLLWQEVKYFVKHG